MKLDKKDFMLIELLTVDGRASLSDLGKKLGLSHVAVRTRLMKLIDNKIININTGINSGKLNFINTILCLEVMDINKYVKDFEHCFRIYEMTRTSGKYNLIVKFFAENMNTLNSVLYNCKFTTDSNIKNFSVNISIESEFRLNIKSIDQECKQKCGNCKEFISNRCVGCPISDKYDGSFKKTIHI